MGCSLFPTPASRRRSKTAQLMGKEEGRHACRAATGSLQKQNCPPDGACRPFSCHKPRLAGSWAFTPSPACGRGRGVRVGPFRQNAPIYKTFNSKEHCQDLVGMDASLSRKRERESNPYQYAPCLNHRCVKHLPAQASTARQTSLAGHFRATSPVWRAVGLFSTSAQAG